MQQRDYRHYIDKAKENRGFKYDSQIDEALGFKGSMTTMILKKGKHLSEEKMLELAAMAGISDIIALMDLHIWKSENDNAKKAYAKILQKITACLIGACGLTTLTAAPALASVGALAAAGGVSQCLAISALLYIMESEEEGSGYKSLHLIVFLLMRVKLSNITVQDCRTSLHELAA